MQVILNWKIYAFILWRDFLRGDIILYTYYYILYLSAQGVS